MIKRLFSLFFALLLLFPCDLARGERFDFSPYQMECEPGGYISGHRALINEHDYASNYWENGYDHALAWWRDGKMIRKTPVPANSGAYYFIAREDGSCGAVRILDNQTPGHFSVTFFDWTEAGLLQEREILEMAIAGESEQYYRDYFSLMEIVNDQAVVHLFDGHGNTLDSVTVDPALEARRMTNVAWSGGESWAAQMFTYPLPINSANPAGDQFFVLILRDGQIVWQSERNSMPYTILADGQDGFMIVREMGQDTYKPLEISHYDGWGRLLWQKTLTGDRVLLSVASARIDAETGHIFLMGNATANSRKIYRVFRAELDENGNLLAMDTRECNYGDSYMYRLLELETPGKAVVLCEPTQRPKAVVPFDALPQAENPDITLR